MSKAVKKGVIRVVEYQGANYHEPDAKDADAAIKNIRPLVLDVRTEAEYASGLCQV